MAEDRSAGAPRRRGSLANRLARALFGDVLAEAERQAAAGVSVRVDDGPQTGLGWEPLHRAGPQDRDHGEWLQDQTDALEAWRKNFLVRRIVTLTRSYVLGGGITISSAHAWVERFAQDFLHHPRNRLPRRYGPMVDELTRAGELFPVLFTNRADGMSYVRFVPASQIRTVETDPEDYETELAYIEATPYVPAGRRWLAPDNPDAWQVTESHGLPPVMLHYAVNRPIGGTRGESDLAPVLRWCLRYSNWLEDRVRLNRVRTRQGLIDIRLADDTRVRDRKRQVETEDPVTAGFYVHGPGEEITLHNLQIGADDAEPDGRALRLAIAAGANTALHYLGEGAMTNYATAREMGEPSARFYTDRQAEFCHFLLDLVAVAYRRKAALGLATLPARDDFALRAAVTETARADNQGLAEAANRIVQALATMKTMGWIDDPTAVRLAFKFAGEAIAQREIDAILDRSGIRAGTAAAPQPSDALPATDATQRHSGGNAGPRDAPPSRQGTAQEPAGRPDPGTCRPGAGLSER